MNKPMTPEVSFHTIIMFWRMPPLVRHTATSLLHVTRPLDAVNCHCPTPSKVVPNCDSGQTFTDVHSLPFLPLLQTCRSVSIRLQKFDTVIFHSNCLHICVIAQPLRLPSHAPRIRWKPNHPPVLPISPPIETFF